MDVNQVGGPGPINPQIPPLANRPKPQDQKLGSFQKLIQANRQDIPSSSLLANNITISAHARDRLKMRNIVLNDDDIHKISGAMDRVAEKGGRQALLYVSTAGGKQTAMVVSVVNRVVITAVDAESLRDNIFTNIDAAAIVH